MNIKYLIRVENRNLFESVVAFIYMGWSNDISRKSHDKIIIYYNSRDEVCILNEILDCFIYIFESGT